MYPILEHSVPHVYRSFYAASSKNVKENSFFSLIDNRLRCALWRRDGFIQFCISDFHQCIFILFPKISKNYFCLFSVMLCLSKYFKYHKSLIKRECAMCEQSRCTWCNFCLPQTASGSVFNLVELFPPCCWRMLQLQKCTLIKWCDFQGILVPMFRISCVNYNEEI